MNKSLKQQIVNDQKTKKPLRQWYLTNLRLDLGWLFRHREKVGYERGPACLIT
jgi:hypothetical protein